MALKKGGLNMKKRRLFAYLAVIAVLIAAFALMGASCSVSTANVSNVVVSTGVDENGMPTDNVSSVPPNTDVYVTAELHNAPDETTVTYVWYIDDQELDRVSFDNQGMTDVPIYSYLTVTASGTYNVEIFVDDREEADASAIFTVQ
jgi:hypothetical protein